METQGTLIVADRIVTTITIMPSNPRALLCLAHGAGTRADHPIMQSLAAALHDEQIATFRYNFPFAERGGGRDGKATTMSTIRAALRAARGESDAPLIAGGHSFGGRMTSIFAAEEALAEVEALLLFGFPLHRPGAPSVERADHLPRINVPVLFVGGTRDVMASEELLTDVVETLETADVRWIAGASHAYKIAKRDGAGRDAFREASQHASTWLRTIGL